MYYATNYNNNMQKNNMTKIKINAGFTLIELMLVIALMATLIGFALPSYQNYLQRTQIAEGFALATPIQMAINEIFYEAGQAPPNLQALGITHSPQGRFIKNLNIKNGAIVIYYGNQANKNLQAKTLRLIPYLNPDQSLVWRCQQGSLPADATLAPGAEDTSLASDVVGELLPQSCRATNG